MDAPFPMHPSYEDRGGRARPGVPVGLARSRAAHMVAAWATVIAGSSASRRRELLHLHHLTPLHDAAALALPGVPVVTHLHGTELKMLDAHRARSRPRPGAARALVGRAHARAAARRADATIAISPHERGEAVRLLGLDPTTVHCLPNGVDVERFAVPRAERRRAARALARLARARPAGLGRGDRRAGEHPLLRGRGRSTRSSTRPPGSRARC